MLAHVRKGDTVVIRKGKERGDNTRGEVIRVDPERGVVFVAKVRMVKRHTKPSQKQRSGGIVEKEAGIRMANVLVVCARCGRGRRTRTKILSDGGKSRACVACGDVVPTKGV